MLDVYGYKKNSTSNLRPDNFLLTNTVRHLVDKHEEFFTEGFYTLALQQINWRYYTFPSYYIGQYGAYDALRFVFSNGGLNHLVKDHSIIISRENSLYDIETAKTKVGDNFREKYNIQKNATVIFFAPGNTIGESEYSLEDFRKGYNEFISKYSYPSSLSTNAPSKDLFKLIVSVQKDSENEKEIRDFISGAHFESNVQIVTDEHNQHFEAICASDFGFVYNGQLLSAAVALHLNVITMQNMNDLHYFWHTWENRWLSDINTNADRPVVPEFAAGEYWFGKIANKLSEMHTNTEMKWDQVRALRPFITEMLPIKTYPREKNSYRDVKFIEGDPTVYDEYEDPIYVMSKRIVKSMEGYKNNLAVEPDASILKAIPSLTLNNSLLTGI